jgi:hypothetical protein
VILAVAALSAAAGRFIILVDAGEHPVPGADVEIRASGGDVRLARVKTGPDGRAPALDLAPGVYDVEVHPENLPYAALHDVVLRAGQEFPLRVALSPEPHSVVVEGIVTDGDGRKLAGALVAGWSQSIHFGVATSPARVHTDDAGKFRLAALSNEMVTVEARSPTGATSRLVVCEHFHGCSPRIIVTVGVKPPRDGFPPRPALEWTAPPSYLVRRGSHLHARIAGVPQDATSTVAILPVSRREPVPVHAMACQEGWFDCDPPAELPWQRFLVHGNELDL